MKKVSSVLGRLRYTGRVLPVALLLIFSMVGSSVLVTGTVYAQTQAEATDCYTQNNGKARNELLSNGSCLTRNGGNCSYTATGVVCTTTPGGDPEDNPGGIYDDDPHATNDECADTSQTSFGWGTGCATVNDLLSMIAKTLAGLVGVAVVGGIIWGGMLYSTSNGNASKAQQGITFIINAVIGLLLFIFMFALTNFLVPGGILG